MRRRNDRRPRIQGTSLFSSSSFFFYREREREERRVRLDKCSLSLAVSSRSSFGCDFFFFFFFDEDDDDEEEPKPRRRTKEKGKNSCCFLDGACLRALLRTHPERRRGRFSFPLKRHAHTSREEKATAKVVHSRWSQKSKKSRQKAASLLDAKANRSERDDFRVLEKSNRPNASRNRAFFFVSEGEWMEPGGVVQQRVFFSFIIGREVKRQLFFPFFFLVFVSVCQKRFTQTHKHVLTARLSLFYPLSFVRTENTHTKTGSRHGPSRFRSHGNRTRRS